MLALHSGPHFLKDTEVVDDLGFVKVNNHWLQEEIYAEVFAFADVTKISTGNAESLAHFEAKA